MRRLLSTGLWALVPAPVVFGYRALLELAGWPIGTWTGILTGLAGTISLVGIACILAATWRTERRAAALAGALTAVLGHFLLRIVDQDLAAAATYVGTGMLGNLAQRRALWAGGMAGTGAALRLLGPVGWLILAPATWWLAVELASAALRARPGGHTGDLPHP